MNVGKDTLDGRGLGRWLGLVVLALAPLLGWGQTSITPGGAAVTQNFNNTVANAVIGTDWRVDAPATSFRTLGDYASAGTAAARTNSAGATPSTGGSYAFVSSTTAADRAIGGLSSGTAAASVNVYAALKNTGTSSIASFNISYNVEKYRNGTSAYRIQLYSSTDGSTWTIAPDANFTTNFIANSDILGSATTPSSSTAVSGVLTQTVNANGLIYLAWNYSATTATSGSSAQALGIDDVSITANAPASITTGTASPATLCAGSNVTVNYTPTGTFTGTYQAKLSDASGSFTATGYPLALTTVASGTTAGSVIVATIPATLPAGTGYKIRVDNTTPATTGSTSATTLAVNNITIAPVADQAFFTFGSGTTLNTTEGGPITNRQWYYGTSSGSYGTLIGGATGTSYTPTAASLGGNTATTTITYYVVAKADISGCGNVTSNEVKVVISPAVLPSVSTTSVGSVASTSATVTGNLSNNGTYNVTERGAVYSSTNATPTLADSKTVGAGTSGIGSFTTSLSGLLPGTPYNVRSYATSAAGTSYGSPIPFTTTALATVSTDDITTFTASTAAAGGNVSADGGAGVTERGVVYTTSPATPTTADSKTIGSPAMGTGAFTASLSGLAAGITYNVRAYAINAVGTAYGPMKSFTTTAVVVPTLTTDTPGSVGLTSAVLGGNVSDGGGAPVSGRGIVYVVGTTSTPSLTNGTVVPNGSGTGAFSATISGLSNSTTYSAVAYATNSAGTGYGAVQQFTTLTPNPVPVISTLSPSSATANDPAFTLTITGSSFASGATVLFNTTTLTPLSITGTQITVTVPAAALTTAATVNVSVTNPAPAGGTSGALPFVINPAPTITFNPTSLPLGTVATGTAGPLTSYTVSGTNLPAGGISIAAPARVELSLDGFATAGVSSLTLTQAQGTAGVTVWARLLASASAGSVSGTNIVHTSGTTTRNLPVTGTVTSGAASACLSEAFTTFDGTAGSIPSGTWGVTSLGFYTTIVGNAANAVKFDGTNDQLVTPLLTSGTAASLSFYMEGNGATDATSSLLVEGFNGTAWATIAAISPIAGTGVTKTYNAGSSPALPVNTYNQFRFTYTKGAINLAFDDVAVTCSANLTTTVGTLGGPVCAGETIDQPLTVPFTVSNGSFAAGNTFRAFLSDATGSFVSETAISSPAQAGVSSGTITNAKIPAGTASGSGYRVRVKGSNPTTGVVYTSNATALKITRYSDNEVVDASYSALSGNTQVTLTFTAPSDCASRIVVIGRRGAAPTIKPLTGSSYSANSVFGSGTDAGAAQGGITQQYVVYDAAATVNGGPYSVVVTGLTNGQSYSFKTYVSNGDGFSDGALRSATPVVPASLTELVVPQYISGRPTTGSTHDTRLPYVWRATIGNLTPSTTYRYYTAVRGSGDAPTNGGAGIPIETRTAGAFVRKSGPLLNSSSSTFTTDATGPGSTTFTSWFGVEPSTDSRFNDQATVFPMVVLNAGDGNSVATQFLPTTSAVTAVQLGTGSTQATAVRGTSFGTPGNMVLTYSNTAGTGRPLAGTWLESDGQAQLTPASTPTAGSYANFYATADGTAGAYGLLTSNNNASGIRRVEQVSLADGSLVGCAATDADGTWPGTPANTTSTGPKSGTTALVLTTADTPFQPTIVTGLGSTSRQAGQTLTISGTNFVSGPNPTVTFTGGATAVSATVAADGTSLTVVVPAAAQSGTVSVAGGCGSAPTSAALIIVPLTFYTVTGAADLSSVNSFTGNSDGSVGIMPNDFATAGQTFNIIGTNRTFVSNWTVGGSGSKVVLAANASLIIPATAVLTATLDQLAGSTLIIQNPNSAAITSLTQGVRNATSTIDLAQTGATVYTVPTSLIYQNLKLTGGRKRIGGDNGSPLTVARDLTFDGTEISGTFLNSSVALVADYPTFLFGGNFTQLNGTTFDATRSVVFQPTNTSTVQSLTTSTSGGAIVLFDIFSSGTTEKGFRLSGTGAVLQLGNQFDGGFALFSANTSLTLDAGTTLRFTPGGGGRFFLSAYGEIKADPLSNIEINRGSSASTQLGYLPLATGFTTVNNFTLNVGAAEYLSLFNDMTVNGTLSLQSGLLDFDAYRLTINGPYTAGAGKLSATSTSLSTATADLVISGSGALAPLTFDGIYRQVRNFTLNRAGATATLATPLVVGNTLTLTNGIISSTATNLLSLTRTAAAAVSGGSASSYVNGPLARATAAAAATVFFPIGKDAAYRPLTLNTANQSNTRTYTAEQVNSSARSTLINGTNSGQPSATAALTRVSSVRFFTVTSSPTSGTYSGTVTLSFGADDFVNYPGDASFVVAKRVTSPAGAWGNFGRTSSTGAANSGSYVAGTLTSGTFTSFSDFSLASTAAASNNALNTANPLPVELTSFQAQRQANAAVVLKWATASEKNSAYFEVQRSLNGETFATIATIAAQGSSAKASFYTATDASAPMAQLYYRLHQVDNDGTASYSPVVVVAPNKSLNPAVALYPNPARESISFSVVATTPYRVINTLSQTMLKGSAEAGEATVSVANLPAGAYYLELQTSTGRTMQKFVKE